MRSCTRNRPTTASFLGSAAVGLFLPKIPAPLRLPVHVTAMKMPPACYLDSQAVSSEKPPALIEVFLFCMGETVHGGSLSSYPCFTPTQLTSFSF